MGEIDRLKAELEQTRLAYYTAIQINQFKTGFLGRTAHEIRSPLSSLISLHQLILADLCESPEEEKEFIQQSYEAAQKLLKIIDEIVLVSKLEYGKIYFIKESISLRKILSDVFDLVHLQAANKNIKLNIEEILLEIHILSDEKHLILALTNLLDTAITWTKLGEIKLRVTTEKSLGIIQIKCDSELSIWQESRDLLAQPVSTSKEYLKEFAQTLEMSAGQKYLLAMNLIEAMGGNLTLIEETSAPNITQLQITFPLVDK